MYKLYQKEEALLLVVLSAIGGLLVYLAQPDFTSVLAFVGYGFLVPLAAKLWDFTIQLAFSGSEPTGNVISGLFGTTSDNKEEYNNLPFVRKVGNAFVVLLINTFKGIWYFILFGIGIFIYNWIKSNN